MFFKITTIFLSEGLTFFPAMDSKQAKRSILQDYEETDTHTRGGIVITLRLHSITACVISIIPRDYGYSTGSGLYIPSMLYNMCMEPLMSMASIE